MAEAQTRGSTSGHEADRMRPWKRRVGALLRVVSVRGRGRGSWAAITAMLVLAGALAAVLGARSLARSDVGRQRLAARLAADDVAATLKLAIRHEEDLTVSMSAFVASNPNVTPLAFDVWVESMHTLTRYHELQNIGLAKFVPASQLAAFEARMAARPLRPLGSRSTAPAGRLQILPAGKRPYYCLAVAGMARSAASYVPVGLDYCALIKSMISARDSGLTGYAPLANAGSVTLGIETPVYRGGVPPSTVAARRRAFVGWLGELITPDVLLQTALAGHPNTAAVFRYDSSFSHIQVASGSLRGRVERRTIALQVGREAGLANPRAGWTVQVLTASVARGVFAYRDALLLLVGGILLSVLVGLLVLVLGSGRARARRLVRVKTRELSQKNRQLAELALHDTLTGLPNRALVLDRAAQMLARAARQPDIIAGALFVDVDSFKRVNDELGHAAGDQLLRTVGERLQSAVRNQDTVGRLGGDEFIVLAECAVDDTTLDLLAERLTEILRQPVQLDDGRKIFSVTASIGVASGRYETPDALLRDADLALYAAKAAGKDRYTLFDTSMRAGEEGRIQIEAGSAERESPGTSGARSRPPG
jgi:diguanylate cyclase (GGDEF)-like protein